MYLWTDVPIYHEYIKSWRGTWLIKMLHPQGRVVFFTSKWEYIKLSKPRLVNLRNEMVKLIFYVPPGYSNGTCLELLHVAHIGEWIKESENENGTRNKNENRNYYCNSVVFRFNFRLTNNNNNKPQFNYHHHLHGATARNVCALEEDKKIIFLLSLLKFCNLNLRIFSRSSFRCHEIKLSFGVHFISSKCF